MDVNGYLHVPDALNPRKEHSIPTGSEAEWTP
jgi:hypothetical protein